MSSGTPLVEAVFLTPNEYHTISRIGRTKKNPYHRIDGMASENDGARSRLRRGGAATAAWVVNMSNAAGGRGLPISDMSTSPSGSVAGLPSSRARCGLDLVEDVDQPV